MDGSTGHAHQIHVPGTSEVSPKLQLPMEALVRYLQERHGMGDSCEPTLRQFRHGQSNPTYYLAYGGEEMVLRKKPERGVLCSGTQDQLVSCLCAQPGKLLPLAHAVEREYRVMEAAGREGVPIPELLSLCEDSRYTIPILNLEFRVLNSTL